eukprot:1382437-Rhodomonas_salina.1
MTALPLAAHDRRFRASANGFGFPQSVTCRLIVSALVFVRRRTALRLADGQLTPMMRAQTCCNWEDGVEVTCALPLQKKWSDFFQDQLQHRECVAR